MNMHRSAFYFYEHVSYTYILYTLYIKYKMTEHTEFCDNIDEDFGEYTLVVLHFLARESYNQ